MSHFTVLVVMDPERFSDGPLSKVELEREVTDCLSPFQETYGEGEPYVEWVDRTDKVLEDRDRVVGEDDNFLQEHLGAKVGETLGDVYLRNFEDNRDEYLEEIRRLGSGDETEADVTPARLVGSLWSEHQYRDGSYGYYANPQGKWDWYQIGGRWSGSLLKKTTAEGGRGELSWTNESMKLEPHQVDYCRIRDLDLDAFETQTREAIDKFWGDYCAYISEGAEDTEPYGINYKLTSMGIEWVNREEFQAATLHNREVRDAAATLAFREFREGESSGSLSQWQRERFERDKRSSEELETIASQPVQNVPDKAYDRRLTLDELRKEKRWFFEWSTFAVISEGEWFEKGEMGWFGCSTDSTLDKECWSEEFWDRFIRNRDPDTVIAVVDCHV